MNDTFRDILVSVELILVLLAFSFSVATLSLGKNEAFNIIYLVVTIIGCLHAFGDAVSSLSGFKFCRACRRRCHNKVQVKESKEVGDIDEVQSEQMLSQGRREAMSLVGVGSV